MVKKKIKVTCAQGIHLRPASMVSQEAIKYQSDIQILKGERVYSMKSVISLLGSQIKENDEIEVVCDGPDEEDALQGVTAFLENLK